MQQRASKRKKKRGIIESENRNKNDNEEEIRERLNIEIKKLSCDLSFLLFAASDQTI